MDIETAGINVVSEAELLDTILGREQFADRVAQLTFLASRILEAKTIVLGQTQEELSVSIVLENLLRSLDAVLGYELIKVVRERAQETFSGAYPPVPHDPIVIANLLDSASVLLRGEGVFKSIIKFARQALTIQSEFPVAIRLESARLLYDAGALGESPDFWMDLCSRSLASNEPIVYVALSALMLKWPTESLEYIFHTCATANGDAVSELADLIATSAEEITNGVSFDQFLQLYLQYASQLHADVREAIQNVAAERGWSLQGAPAIGARSLVRAVHQADLGKYQPVRYDAGERTESIYTDHRRVKLLSWLPTIEGKAEFEGQSWAAYFQSRRRASPLNNPFPQEELEWLKYMRAAPLDDRHLQGSLELSFTREAVDNEIRHERAEHPLFEDEALLHAINRHLPIDAEPATEALKRLGFDSHPFILGASEFHQDRLIMSIVAAALKRASLLGAEVAQRWWYNDTFQTVDHRRDANVVIRAKIVDEQSHYGIYKFIGFRVFVRIDTLHDFVSKCRNKKLLADIHQLMDVVQSGESPQIAMNPRTRAKIALHLGELDAKGSAFEGLRSAVAKIAGQNRTKKPNRVTRSNDEAFEKFITGQSKIYCGGAINNLLVDTWWTASQPRNFVEILTHEEIAKGFRLARKGLTRGDPPYVENALDFNLPEERTRVQIAKSELTTLFRHVGTGLTRWSKEVLSTNYLNGNTESCRAARRILSPLPTKRIGRYAFATTLYDPAKLTQTSDLYYDQ